MEKVNVKIDKAQIRRFSVDLGIDQPEIMVTIDLFANDKKVADFYMHSNYNGDTGFPLDPILVDPVLRIAKRLEEIVVDKYNKQLLLKSE